MNYIWQINLLSDKLHPQLIAIISLIGGNILTSSQLPQSHCVLGFQVLLLVTGSMSGCFLLRSHIKIALVKLAQIYFVYVNIIKKRVTKQRGKCTFVILYITWKFCLFWVIFLYNAIQCTSNNTSDTIRFYLQCKCQATCLIYKNAEDQ